MAMTITPNDDTECETAGRRRARATSERFGRALRVKGLQRSRWAAIGAAVAVTLGSGGVFMASAASGDASSIVTIDPVRIIDTRDPVNLGLAGPFVSPVSQKFNVTGSAVPVGATGVLLNATVVGPTADGFLSVRPGDASGSPTTSSLNFLANQILANSVQVALPTRGANVGQIEITYDAFGAAGPTADVLIDVVGYLIPGGAAAGLVGPAGPAGPAGAKGDTGAQGAAGADGTVGPAGADGAVGPAGADGAVGPAGPAGAKGDTGTPGAVGAVGPAGLAGAEGAMGPEGPAGLAGAEGAMGPEGPAGPAGAEGAVGPEGPAGPAGPKGDTGTQGAAGAEGAVGAVGPTGPVGPNGPVGPVGPAGPAGADGADGAVGPIGPVGPAGLSAVSVVESPASSSGVSAKTVTASCLAPQVAVAGGFEIGSSASVKPAILRNFRGAAASDWTVSTDATPGGNGYTLKVFAICATVGS